MKTRLMLKCLVLVATFSSLVALSHADFTVNNILIEVAVEANEMSKGFAGDELIELDLSISNGELGMTDYQIAQATFGLTLDENTANESYSLGYLSDVFVMTGGEGTANALGNAIIVFELSQNFLATSTTSDSILFDSMGLPIFLDENESQSLEPGVYSLSFAASVAILSNATEFTQESAVSGLITFNAIPEPTALSILVLMGMSVSTRRKRR